MARAAARSSRSRSRSNKIEIPDLSGVESATVLPTGDYLFEVVDIVDGEGDKGPYLKWTFEVAEGKLKGKKAKPHITSFAEEALFNLKTVLLALGVDVPEEAFDIDKDELIGLQCMGTIEHDTYQGRKQSKIVDFFDADGREEPEPEPRGRSRSGAKKDTAADKKPAGRGKGKAKEPEKIPQADVEAMNQDELEDLIKDSDLDVDLSEHKTLRKMRAAVVDALGEAELLED